MSKWQTIDEHYVHGWRLPLRNGEVQIIREYRGEWSVWSEIDGKSVLHYDRLGYMAARSMGTKIASSVLKGESKYRVS